MNADHDATGQGDTGQITADRSGSAPGSGSASQDGDTQNSADPGGAVHGQANQNGAAQGSAGQSGEKPAAPAVGPGRAAMITAIALIVVYIVMLFILMSMRNDKEWDRLVYLLSGFEALVFAGAGALFGTTIQRANVTAARNDAADAKKEAADAKQTAQSQSDRAQKAEKDAAAGRFLAAAVTAKADTRASGGSDQLLGPDRALVDTPRVRGSRPGTDRPAPTAGAAGLDADLAELSALARTILPD
ncbi:MAG TPA: hypothetical protein VFQ68_22420 [Streptosporangiaceae bacterium]|nr:hypothetical protein [Streptosporangiaceae bacterium]